VCMCECVCFCLCLCLRGMPCVHVTFATDSCKSIPISFDMSTYLFAHLSAGSNSYTPAVRSFVKFDEWKSYYYTSTYFFHSSAVVSGQTSKVIC
jgi:hypothetical protein